MKTLHINTANQNTNRIRLTMIVAGIVTAIICMLALLYEVQPTDHDGSVNHVIETSKIAITDLSIQVSSKTLVSMLWPF